MSPIATSLSSHRAAPSLLGAVVSAAVLLMGTALAPMPVQAASLVIENAGIQIPLRAGRQVRFDTNGNVTAECQPNDQNGCLGLPNPNGTSVVLNPSATTVARNGSLNIAWVPEAGAEVCLAFSSPQVTAWDGPKAGAGGTLSVTFPIAGSFTLYIQCYDSEGSAGAVSRTITVT